jgi:hypothetical protein
MQGFVNDIHVEVIVFSDYKERLLWRNVSGKAEDCISGVGLTTVRRSLDDAHPARPSPY